MKLKLVLFECYVYTADPQRDFLCFADAEDQIIVEAHEKYRKKWAIIAKLLRGDDGDERIGSGSARLDHGFRMFIPHDTQVRVQLKDGSSFVLHSVRYIPKLKRNLISLGTLEKEGYTIKLQSGKVKVINGSRVILSGIRRNNCVYSFDGHAMSDELNASVEEKDSLAQVWHKRLGHISEAGLQVLEKQGLFGKKSLSKLDFCENCVLGKSHRVNFGVGKHTTQGVIDYVHSDLWGPSQVESLGGKRFKHEAFEKFKECKQLVENQTGRTVKKLRTDNGLEFCNREFEQLCIESGIARHLTVAGTPQQNGVAERMNKTLMDKSPSRAIEKKTPMEMWSGHPSDYGMLRILGCVAYPHDKQGKLEPRAVKCVLLGYPEGVKGYRLYRLDDESPKIVTSRNVVFNESVMYKDKLKDSGAGDKSIEELQHPNVTIPLHIRFWGCYRLVPEPRIMPPRRRLKKVSVKRLVERRVAKAIEEYEKSRANLDGAGSSGGNNGNAGRTVNVQGCSHKTFLNGKPHSFKGTEGVVGLRRWIEKVEQVFETGKCAEEDKVMFAASTFEGRALTWWNGNVHTLGLVNANRIPWTEFKMMMTTEYCPAIEIQKMEQELWTLTLKGDDIEAYNNRFHELALMCPELVPTERKKIEKYVRGFPERIKGNITSSKPATLHDAINMARELVEQSVQGRATRIGESNKRKWEDHQRNPNNNNYNNNNRNRNNNYHQQQNRRQETARAYAAVPAEGKVYAGNLPKCNRCNFHHSGQCPPKCQKCQKAGHLEKDCRVRPPGAGVYPYQDVTCHGCGEKGHFRNRCPKAGNQQNVGARARAYAVGENPQQNPNVVAGTFLLNNHYACILFDSGAEKSFVSSAFTSFIDIAPIALNTSYEIELADGKVVSTNTVLRGCTLTLYNHIFKIDLLPTRLGSFDVIIGMDWLSCHRAIIDCCEKIIRIPLSNGKILEVQGERPEKDPGSLACLPPVRELEFRVDLIPGASPVVKSPYRLAPSEMLELSNQLKELQEKGFIRPSHSPWGAPVLFVKKKDGANENVY
ncbi:putative reverse transcriptase domain-containing protein [Tanacetum coccineum]